MAQRTHEQTRVRWVVGGLLAVLAFFLLAVWGGAGLAVLAWLGLAVGVGGWYLLRWMGARDRPLSQ